MYKQEKKVQKDSKKIVLTLYTVRVFSENLTHEFSNYFKKKALYQS